MNGRPQRTAARLLACAGLAALLAGCASGPTTRARIDPASPIAADAARVLATRRAYPTFAQIPPAPKDVRPAKAYAAVVADTRAAGDQLVRETGPETWSLTGTERFAASAQRQAGADPGAASTEGTEAFASKLRERATPPPPPR